MSQHGCDTHATDPLAHLDGHDDVDGPGGPAVDADRPPVRRRPLARDRRRRLRRLPRRAAGLGVGLARPGATANPPDGIPDGWRERWAAEAARYGIADLPRTIGEELASTTIDAANEISRHTMANIRECLVPKLILATDAAGGWGPLDSSRTDEDRVPSLGSAPEPVRTITILDAPSPEAIERLTYAPRLIANFSPAEAKALLMSCPIDLTLAVSGDLVVGLVAGARRYDGPRDVLGVWVAPPARRRGLATEMLTRHVATAFPSSGAGGGPWHATVTVGERDPVEPLDHALRISIARRILERAGFEPTDPPERVTAVDPRAIAAVRP